MTGFFFTFPKKIQIAFGAAMIIFGGYSFYQSESRHGIYFDNILPLANRQLDQMAISDKANMTYDQYAQIHLAACHLNAQLLNESSDKPYRPFSDEECIELMEKSRPYAKELRYKQRTASK